MEKVKELWLESIGAKEYPEPVKYAYTFPGYNGAFNLSEKYINENSLEELKAISPVFDNDIYDAVSLETCVNKRMTIGAPGPDAMKEVIKINKSYLED